MIGREQLVIEVFMRLKGRCEYCNASPSDMFVRDMMKQNSYLGSYTHLKMELRLKGMSPICCKRDEQSDQQR